MFHNIEELEKQVKEFQQNILASSELIKGIQNLTNMVKIQQTGFDKSSNELLSAIETYTQYVNKQTEQLIKSITEQASKETSDFTKSNNDLIAKFKADSEELIKFIDEKTAGTANEISINNEKLVNEIKTASDNLSCLVSEKVDIFSKNNADLSNRFKSDAEMLIKTVAEQTNTNAKEISDANMELVKRFESKFAEYETSLGLLLDRIKADNANVSENAVAAFATINRDYAKKLDEESSLLKELISKLEHKYSEFIQTLENTNVDRLFAELQDMKKSINIKFAFLFSGVGITIVLTLLSFLIK